MNLKETFRRSKLRVQAIYDFMVGNKIDSIGRFYLVNYLKHPFLSFNHCL